MLCQTTTTAYVAALLLFCSLGTLANVLRCAHEGFSTRSQKNSLTTLFGMPNDGESGDKPYMMAENLVLYDNARISSPCDVMFVNMPATRLMLNEHASIATLQSAYKSMLAQDSDKKKDIVIFLSGSEEDIAKAEINLRKLLAEAWILSEKQEFVSDNVEDECNIRIVALTESGKDEAAKVVTGIISQLISGGAAGVPSSEFQETFQEVSSDIKKVKTPSGNYLGYEVCEKAKMKALIWAQDAAQASATRLQKQERAGDFIGFMDNLVKKAEDMYKEGIYGLQSDTILSPFHAKRGLTEVHSQIYAMLLPFFRRHVQLARVESAKSFNAKAGDDLAITTDIMSDLKEIQEETMRDFTKACEALQPAGAPATWTFDFDVKQLRMSLDEYLESREAQAKLVGVLPRGRKPIDISLHYFANHPLGKDYRQDALSLSAKDQLVYDAGVAKAKTRMASPSHARAKLKQKEKSGSLSLLESGRVKADSEFAREMLMFPLSIKNPDVPLSAGRSKKASSVDAARKQAVETELGPDRFVDWNVDTTMQEAKRALDKAVSRKKEEQQSNAKSGFQRFPIFKKGYYKHPPLNYDGK